ncbi:MAG TPA: hypothetical protein VHV77_01315, partial [Pirellulales bacterium]|nr:hypothetical protein [Pirellulales bacterium]
YRVHELMQDIRRVVREKDETLAHENDRVEEAVENIAQELDEKLSVEEQSPPAQAPESPPSSDAVDGKEAS